jgi:hypothetical protein
MQEQSRQLVESKRKASRSGFSRCSRIGQDGRAMEMKVRNTGSHPKGKERSPLGPDKLSAVGKGRLKQSGKV